MLINIIINFLKLVGLNKVNKLKPIKYWANDPSSNVLLETTHKELDPPVNVIGYLGGGNPINSYAGRSANCHAIMGNCLDLLKYYKPESWIKEKPLNVYPIAGIDLNAYYDRKSIKFFYYFDFVIKKNIYLSESADVVSHEFGHAILDAIRPDFWDVQSYEIWALHESFGDIIAVLNILNNDKILEAAIKETKNDLFKSNVVSRLAEHFAKTIFNVTKGKLGHNPHSLRDAVNNFEYVDPKELPEEDSHNKLSKECHSFSRIMTGCLYEILIEIYNLEKNNFADLDAMRIARDTLAGYLLTSIKEVPCTNKIFRTLCQKILQVDKKAGSKYSKILIKVFEKRNLLTNYKNLSVQNFYENKEKTKIIEINYQNFNSLKISIPFENKIEYDKNGSLEIFSFNELEESIGDATFCVETLFKSKMIGKSFKIEKNNLIRKKIIN